MSGPPALSLVERDAKVIAMATFGLLDQFLWNGPANQADEDHLVAFCVAAVHR